MIPKRWARGTSSTWASRLRQPAKAEPFGSRRPDRPLSVLFPKRASISGMPTKSGWSTSECMISTKWWPSYEQQGLKSKTRNLIRTSGASLVCMTLKEIPSNCGSLQTELLIVPRVRRNKSLTKLFKRAGRISIIAAPGAHSEAAANSADANRSKASIADQMRRTIGYEILSTYRFFRS